jgi:hypothetical protein
VSAIILPLLADATITRLWIRGILPNHDLAYRLFSNGFEWEIVENDPERSAEWYNSQNGTQQEDKE